MNLSPSERVKRGFHRIGVAIATVLGVGTLAIGVFISRHKADAQQSRFSELRCMYDKMKPLLGTGSGPWEEREELLAEAYKRNILPAEIKAAYEKMVRRGPFGRSLLVDA